MAAHTHHWLFLLVALLLTAPTATAETHSVAHHPGTPWPATDALGRHLPTSADVGPPRPDRFVELFRTVPTYWEKDDHDHLTNAYGQARRCLEDRQSHQSSRLSSRGAGVLSMGEAAQAGSERVLRHLRRPALEVSLD